MKESGPEKQGLYDPCFEHDSCRIGFVVDVHGRKSHTIVEQGAAPTAGTAFLNWRAR